MTTFLLTWNPEKWEWPDDEFALAVVETSAGRLVADGWSTGSRSAGVDVGDRLYLLRQGVEPRGISASGWFESGISSGPHWDGTPGKTANYADLVWDAVLDEDVLPLETLESEISEASWEPRAGGIRLSRSLEIRLESLRLRHLEDLGRKPASQPDSSPFAWLLLAAGSDREHGGNDGYADDPGVTYR